MPILGSLFIVLVAAGILALYGRRRALGIAMLAPVLGVSTYGALGIYIARFRGVGHFYSVPVGGERVTDFAVGASLICWVLIWVLVLWVITRQGAGSPDVE